ncbi:hypothetical protein FEDK69T_25560 [Flavobacterium enshiense DK69]|uniref:Membrane protein n=1 Tax=Flavobacterium enshiense DK69 TaxID=1107311 RepID=V6S460_9FLAO|nr:hypothetical protein [Flavobacterium enshiense]ESU21189.1 hypothetical protein FEDK69T_25560 [Flavobacterium enshiense DK69]KGO93476.1 membrane protein [Flavobacterium enshiense DK69]
MLLKKTNIHEKLISQRKKSGSYTDPVAFANLLLAEDENKRTFIRKKLGSKSEITENTFDFDLLETERIFHLSQIKAICIDYRLRFLDSHLYKLPFPEEAVSKIKNLEKAHQTQLSGFKMIAPSKVFQLKKYNDPLLFAPLGNDYYYLIHKWGNDLHPLRKWLVLPFRNLGTLILFFLMLSAFCCLLVPETFLGKSDTATMRFISFLFIFKYWCAIGIYYAVSRGKNFNVNIWNSDFGG